MRTRVVTVVTVMAAAVVAFLAWRGSGAPSAHRPDVAEPTSSPGLGVRLRRGPADAEAVPQADAGPTSESPSFRVRGRIVAPPDTSFVGASVQVFRGDDPWTQSLLSAPRPREAVRLDGSFDVVSPSYVDAREGARLVASVVGFVDVHVEVPISPRRVVDVDVPLADAIGSGDHVIYRARVVDGAGRALPDLPVDVDLKPFRSGPLGSCGGATPSARAAYSGRSRSDATGLVIVRGVCAYAAVHLSASPSHRLVRARHRWRPNKPGVEDVWTAWPAATVRLEVVAATSQRPVDGFRVSLVSDGTPAIDSRGRDGRFEDVLAFVTDSDLSVDVTVSADGFRPAALRLPVPREATATKATIALRERARDEEGRIVIRVVGGGPDVFGEFRGSNYVRGALSFVGHRSVAHGLWEPVASADERIVLPDVGAGTWTLRLEPAYDEVFRVTQEVRVDPGRDTEVEWRLPPIGSLVFAESQTDPTKEATGIVLRPLAGGEDLHLHATYVTLVPAGTWDVAHTYSDGSVGTAVRVTVEKGGETPVGLSD